MKRANGGFTILEVLLVVVALGLLGSLIVSGFSNVPRAGQDAAAVTKARVINAARLTYSLTVPDAATQWSATVTDLEKTTLLVAAGALNGDAADWLSSPGGYTLSLSGGLQTKTVLRDSAGNALTYKD
jgi:type II secretory pathway pseudopilin PulG